MFEITKGTNGSGIRRKVNERMDMRLINVNSSGNRIS